MSNEELCKKLLRLIREESIADVLNALGKVIDDEATETNFSEQQESLNRVCKAVLEAAEVANEEGV